MTGSIASARFRVASVDLRHVLFGAVLIKPVVDLFWQVEFLTVGRFGLTPQRVLGLSVPVLCVVIVLAARRSLLLREWSLYALLGVGMAAVLLNGPGAPELDQFLRWVAILAVLAVSAGVLGDERDLVFTLRGLVVVSLLPTGICYLQLAGLVPFYYADFVDLPVLAEAAAGVFETTAGTFSYGVGRVSGGYQHPTGYTNYIVVAIPASYALVRMQRLRPLPFGAYLLLTLPAVFFTYDRTAYLVLTMQFGVMLFFARRPALRLILGLLLVGGLLAVGRPLWELVVGGLGSGRAEDFLRGRGLVWLIYFDHWMSGAPWQQALGFGEVVLEHVRISKGAALDEPHSDYLRVLVTYGVLGLLLYLRLLWAGMRGAWSLARDRTAGPAATAMGIVAIMLILTLLAASVPKEPLRYTAFGWPFALLAGGAIARHTGAFALR